MDEQTVLIIGASRGIGLELTNQYCSSLKITKVIATCRKLTKNLSSLQEKFSKKLAILENFDVSNDTIVERLKFDENERLNMKSMKVEDFPIGIKIDVCIYNSGVFELDRESGISRIDFDSCLEKFQVNALGAIRVAKGIEKYLKENSKFIAISSKYGSIGSIDVDNEKPTDLIYSYRMSRAALNISMRTLAAEFKNNNRNIIVGLIFPGLVDTDMLRAVFKCVAQSPEQAVKKIIATVEGVFSQKENSGCFYDSTNGEKIEW